MEGLPVFKSVAFAFTVAGLATISTAAPVLAAGGYPPGYPPYGSVKDAPPPVVYAPPPITWSGIYIGAHVGFAWSESDWNFRNVSNFNTVVGDRAGFDGDGWMGGGQLGFNVQNGRFVWGLEATLSGADISHSRTSPFFADQRLSTDVDLLWTVAGRLGYDWGGLLTYVKAGYAGATVEVSAFDSGLPIVTASKDETLNGWTVGAGVEYLLSPNVIVGVEYNFLDLGSSTYRTFDSDGDAFQVKNDVNIHTLMARLSYKFDSNRYVISPFK